MFSRRRYFAGGIGRRLIGLALLVSLCAAFVPLPRERVDSPDKDMSQPFPCQDRPCGCATAEQCWRQCCCFTNAQKVVWARKNGVTPPDYVVKAAQSEAATKVAKTDPPPLRNCPHCANSVSDCGRKVRCESRSGAADCADSGDCRKSAPTGNVQDDEDTMNYVIGIEALKCRGQGLFWNSLPCAVIPAVQVPQYPADPGRWDRPRSVVVVSIAAEPPEPPPRLA